MSLPPKLFDIRLYFPLIRYVYILFQPEVKLFSATCLLNTQDFVWERTCEKRQGKREIKENLFIMNETRHTKREMQILPLTFPSIIQYLCKVHYIQHHTTCPFSMEQKISYISFSLFFFHLVLFFIWFFILFWLYFLLFNFTMYSTVAREKARKKKVVFIYLSFKSETNYLREDFPWIM